jgi:hypothetical protein
MSGCPGGLGARWPNAGFVDAFGEDGGGRDVGRGRNHEAEAARKCARLLN